MKTINHFLTERLKISKNTKVKLDTDEGICHMIFDYFKNMYDTGFDNSEERDDWFEDFHVIPDEYTQQTLDSLEDKNQISDERIKEIGDDQKTFNKFVDFCIEAAEHFLYTPNEKFNFDYIYKEIFKIKNDNT